MDTYYSKWLDFKPKLALGPAMIFWVLSIVFFIVGLKFEKPMIVFGIEISKWVGLAAGLAITFIQVLGNDQEGEAGLAMTLGWYASYALGIGTNVNGLLSVFNIENTYLAWVIAGSLGVMIEVLPEKFLVQFLRSLKNKPRPKHQVQYQGKQQGKAQPQYRPVNKPAWQPPKPVFRPMNSEADELPPWAKES